jgi:alpha-glucosidase
VVPDQYNELILDLNGPDPLSVNSLQVEARAYNDGVAFRYGIPSEMINPATASAELTKYNFAGDYTAWFYNGEHENIGPEKLYETNGKR